jgi:ubiquinone biosynthesis protein COQ4
MWFITRTIYYLIRLAKDPNQYRLIEKLRALLKSHGYFQITIDHIRKQPANLKILQERAILNLENSDLNRLLLLPVGTLGREYAEFMNKNKLTPILHSFAYRESDEDYIHLRIVQTHDIWHVVLGYGTDVVQEVKLQSFMLSQLRWPNSGFLIGGFILRQMFQNPKAIGSAMDAIVEGWLRGQSTIPLVSVFWENEWETSLVDIRARIVQNRNVLFQESYL